MFKSLKENLKLALKIHAGSWKQIYLVYSYYYISSIFSFHRSYKKLGKNLLKVACFCSGISETLHPDAHQWFSLRHCSPFWSKRRKPCWNDRKSSLRNSKFWRGSQEKWFFFHSCECHSKVTFYNWPSEEFLKRALIYSNMFTVTLKTRFNSLSKDWKKYVFRSSSITYQKYLIQERSGKIV